MKRIRNVITLFCVVCSMVFLISCETTYGNTEQDFNEIKYTAMRLAEAYQQRGLVTDAINVYNLALDAFYDYEMEYNKAVLLYMAGEYQKCIELCDG